MAPTPRPTEQRPLATHFRPIGVNEDLVLTQLLSLKASGWLIKPRSMRDLALTLPEVLNSTRLTVNMLSHLLAGLRTKGMISADWVGDNHSWVIKDVHLPAPAEARWMPLNVKPQRSIATLVSINGNVQHGHFDLNTSSWTRHFTYLQGQGWWLEVSRPALHPTETQEG